MPTQEDLFVEEQQMVTMSFGDHLEELRVRLILAILGLAVGMIVMLLPPLHIGWFVMTTMTEPADQALQDYQKRVADRMAEEAAARQSTLPLTVTLPADQLIRQFREIAPAVPWPEPESAAGRGLDITLNLRQSEFIHNVADSTQRKNAVISLSPLESVTIFLMVCLVSGLVFSSPWVFYQIWAFVAAGLYQHERHYVKKFLPMSILLFLGGVALCFFVVLPITLRMLLEFNAWVNIEPNMRLSEWMGFATILPLVFGVCFQTPLVMLFLERVGVFNVRQYREKRKYAVIIIFTIAAVLTPDPLLISMILLALPMYGLYEVGILLVDKGVKERAAAAGNP